MKHIQCKNCDFQFEGNYCPQCGQNANIERYNLKYLYKILLESLDLERGFLSTIFSLLYKPGLSIRLFIHGKRVGFYNSLKLFFISGAIASLITFKFDLFNTNIGPLDFLSLPDQENYNYISGKYFTFFTLDALPLFSLFTWIIFRKKGYNFSENFILNIYIASAQFILTILYSPVLIFYSSDLSMTLYGMILLIYNIWAVSVFFKAYSAGGLMASIASVLLPAVLILFINYGVYRLSPDFIWESLELLF
ncbi:MAG: DUF3667 domain-containing protein [Cyclobacteriaceae bacterium]|nr:DUF3667 domain-containing protein [Cyclobacteriaceae bacterium]